MNLDEYDEAWQKYIEEAEFLFNKYVGKQMNSYTMESMSVAFRTLHRNHSVETELNFPFITFKEHGRGLVELVVYPVHPYVRMSRGS